MGKRICSVLLAVMLLAVSFAVPALAADKDAGSAGVSFDVPVGIELEGPAPSPDETYTILLTAKSDDAPLPDGASDGVYKAAFEGAGSFSIPLEFTKLGTYKYEISQEPGDGECEYDDQVYTLTVYSTVDKDGTRKTSFAMRNEDGDKVDEALFTNVYPEPEPEYEPGEYTPTVQKVIEEENGTAPDDSVFSFTLIPDDPDSPMPVNKQADVDPETGAMTIEVEGDGAHEFGEMTFTENEIGTYTYTVKEVETDEDYYTFDGTVYTLTIVTTLDEEGEKVVLEATITGGDDDELVFTNVYDEPNITPDKIDPPLKKLVNEVKGTAPTDSIFTFVMEPDDPDAPMPDNKEATLDKTTGALSMDVQGPGEYEFGWMTFDESTVGNVYTYTVKEVDNGEDNYSYDVNIYTMVVQPELEDHAVIAAYKITDSLGKEIDDFEFTNVYEEPDEEPIEPAKIDPPLKKIVTEVRGKAPADSVFTFVMTPGDKSYPMPDNKEAKIDPETGALTMDIKGPGEYEFGWMTFGEKEVGRTYSYSVIEVAKGEKNYSYDVAVYYIDVEVKLEGNKVVLDVTTTDVFDREVDEIVFTNVYQEPEPEPELVPGRVDPGVRKIVASNRGVAPKDAPFTFALIPADSSYPLPENRWAKWDPIFGVMYLTKLGAGEYGFGWITFDEDDIGKTYTYAIKEVAGRDPLFRYDSSVYYMTVKVSLVGNRIVLDVTYTDSFGRVVDMPTFTNIYEMPVNPPPTPPTPPKPTPGPEPTPEPEPTPVPEPTPEPTPDVPVPPTPNTGDSSNIALWLSLLGLSGAGIIVACVLYKKKQRQN